MPNKKEMTYVSLFRFGGFPVQRAVADPRRRTGAVRPIAGCIGTSSKCLGERGGPAPSILGIDEHWQP